MARYRHWGTSATFQGARLSLLQELLSLPPLSLWSQEDEMAAYWGVEKIDMKHFEKH